MVIIERTRVFLEEKLSKIIASVYDQAIEFGIDRLNNKIEHYFLLSLSGIIS
jgi:hypothetical protein